jgi:integrase
MKTAPQLQQSPKVFYSKSKKAFVAKQRRPDGSWKNVYVPVSIQDESTANAWFMERTRLDSTGDTTSVPVLSTSIRGLRERWIDLIERDMKLRGKAKSLVVRDVGSASTTLDLHVLSHPIADIPLEKLSLSDATGWVTWLRENAVHHRTKRPLAPYTLRNVVSLVRRLVTDAEGRGWSRLPQGNPFLHPYVRGLMRGAARVAGKSTVVCLTQDHVERLVGCKALLPIRRTRITLAVTSGLRTGELSGLSWGDVQDDRIRCFVQLIDSKPTFAEPKRGSKRWLPLHKFARKALDDWKETGWVEWVGREPTDDDPVFPDQKGNWSKNCHTSTFTYCLTKAGIPLQDEAGNRYTWHCLRRTFATMLSDEGAPLEIVKALLGHGASGVTDSSYISKNLPRFQKWIEKIKV